MSEREEERRKRESASFEEGKEEEEEVRWDTMRHKQRSERDHMIKHVGDIKQQGGKARGAKDKIEQEQE